MTTARIPMIATTIVNSIKVKPSLLWALIGFDNESR